MKYLFLIMGILFLSSYNSSAEKPTHTNTTDSIISTTLNLSESKVSINDTFMKIEISKELAKEIKPIINKWLQYYNIQLYDFKLEAKDSFNFERLKNDTDSPYYAPYSSEDDIYRPVLYEYSPNKTKYIDLFSSIGVYLEDDGKYYFAGSDDSHQLHLYDRKDKSIVMFSFRGISNFADAVFWVDNNIFIVAAYDENEYGYTLEIYNLKANTYKKYLLKQAYDDKLESYGAHKMKKRGVIDL